MAVTINNPWLARVIKCDDTDADGDIIVCDDLYCHEVKSSIYYFPKLKKTSDAWGRTATQKLVANSHELIELLPPSGYTASPSEKPLSYNLGAGYSYTGGNIVTFQSQDGTIKEFNRSDHREYIILGFRVVPTWHRTQLKNFINAVKSDQFKFTDADGTLMVVRNLPEKGLIGGTQILDGRYEFGINLTEIP